MKRPFPPTLLFVPLALAVGRLLAQQPAPAPAPDAPPPAAPAPAAPAVEIKSAAAPVTDPSARSRDAGRDTLSVDFPDEDIRTILRNVADLFELNIVMPEALRGKTTVKLRDVTWRQIFENILQPVGYTYKEEGNIIKILSNETLAQEPVSTEVFVINDARAADIMATVTSLVDAAAGGKIVVDARSNSLVVTERPSRMNRIRAIIQQLDRATDQVMIETKFIEVTDSDVKNLGVNWSSLANYEVAAGGLGGTFRRNRDQVGSGGFNGNNANTVNDTRGTTRSGTTGTTSESGTTSGSNQSSGSNNSSSVTSTGGVVTPTSTTGSTGTLGTTGTSSSSSGSTNSVTDGVNNALTNTLDNTFNSLASLVNNDGTARTLNAVFSATEFRLVLSALQSQTQVKIVSNPTVVTLNNSEAVINVGQERPIPRYQYNQQTGNLEVNGFDFKPIGVILKVTPQVNAAGRIKLTVAPEVSQSINNVVFNGNQIPIIDTRKTATTVSLADGYTMGIGGLLTSSSSDGGNRVPFLGAIPGIGRLFRSENKRQEMTNLIIFITAKTLSADGAPVEKVFESERVRSMNLRREELPGHRDGSDPFVKTPAAKAPVAK
ncbi:MAG: secretin and TonB N-terminal domain-containing protein [Opitutaceae bacterium]|nr:secretin and TonB N-terminal domain-containing protein [Opitutaceae bacterium]